MARAGVSMSSKQYTDEFRAEAVKQVLERGFTLVDVAAPTRLSTPATRPLHTLPSEYKLNRTSHHFSRGGGRGGAQVEWRQVPREDKARALTICRESMKPR